MLTPNQADRLIHASRPPRGWLRTSGPLLLGLSMILGALLADPGLFGVEGPWTALLPQVLLFTLAGLMIRSALRQRRTGRQLTTGLEAVQLHRWEQARAALTALLQRPVRHRVARAEALLGLAAVAEADQCHETAQRIYEAVAMEPGTDPLQAHTARVALGAAMLRTGQTTDAINLIDRLAREDMPPMLKAPVELLALFREIVMGQSTEALTHAERRRALFREHLSTRAGYGYGLLAAAYDRAEQPDAAKRCWHDATLLIPAAELITRFDELKAVASRYPSAEVPL